MIVGSASQDFEVSEVQWPNHISNDLEKFWILNYVLAELLFVFLCFELIWEYVE